VIIYEDDNLSNISNLSCCGSKQQQQQQQSRRRRSDPPDKGIFCFTYPHKIMMILFLFLLCVPKITFSFVISNIPSSNTQSSSLLLSKKYRNIHNNNNNDGSNNDDMQRPFNKHSTTTTTTTTTSRGPGGIHHLPHIRRVLCLSDLHTDHVDNLSWLANRTQRGDISSTDLIVVAGDISHDLERLEESFTLLLNTGASVVFVCGNHEAWLSSTELKQVDSHNNTENNATTTTTITRSDCSISSLTKLERIYQHCHELGVLTGCTLVGETTSSSSSWPLWIVPLDSWYDGSLDIGSEDLIHDFPKWPWVDFVRTVM
jgi:hypothetical protein